MRLALGCDHAHLAFKRRRLDVAGKKETTMKTALYAAAAALTLAFAPLAHAQEGNGNPFSFQADPIGTARFDASGAVVAELPGTAQPGAALTATPDAETGRFGAAPADGADGRELGN